MDDIKIYFSDWYRDYNLNNNLYINLLRKHYNVKIDPESPDILFYSCFGFSYIKYKCTKVFCTGEAVIPNFNECDYAIGFSPIEFGERYFQKKPHIRFNKNEVDYNLLNRKFCNFIYSQSTSGEGALLRRQFCQMLMKYKDVDAPGRVLNNMKGAITPRYGGDWATGKLDFIKNYKFTFAIENVGMEGYITEKLLQALQAHSVPIYWGAPDIDKYLNTKAFIHLRDFGNLKDAVEYIRYLDNNDDEYMKILSTNPNLNDNENDGDMVALEKFLCSIIENGNKIFSKNSRMMWEPKENLLLDNTAKLAELYLDSGDIQKARECAEICLHLNRDKRIEIYPILEDIYSGNKNEFLALLNRKKREILGESLVHPEYLKELCKIAACYMHLGEHSEGEDLMKYILQCDPDHAEAKNILVEKSKRGGKAYRVPNRDAILSKWEEFKEFGYATPKQRSAVLSYCLKYPVRFVYDEIAYEAYKKFLQMWHPYRLKDTPLIRIGSRNYGGHTMAEPGNQGIAMGLGNSYGRWNYDMAERGFTVYRFAERDTEPSLKHQNLIFQKILFNEMSPKNVITEIFKPIEGLSSRDIVMQMDIRDKEWDLLDVMTETQLKYFKQMAIDFHGVTNESKHEFYVKVFKKLNKTHRIVHLQYNNNVTILCFKDFLISDVIRITYVRRDVGDFSVSEESFPLSMDYPTIPNLPEVFIGKFSDILDNESNLTTSEEQCNLPTNDSWRTFYQDAVLYTDWLKKKNIYQRNSTLAAAGYNYLYVLCRLLNDYLPGNILEFNFDQATKMTAQYATSHETSLTVLANNRERVMHLMKSWDIQWNNVVIHGSELLKTMENGNQGVVYQNFTRITKGKKYNLILLKSPLQNDISIHLDILSCMTDILEDDFAILMDHIEDECGQRVYQEMIDILNNVGVKFLKKDFPAQNHTVGLLASESWKYITEF